MKNLLKVKRWETGMKQFELANRLECSAPYISMIENGRMEPTEEFKERAAAIFNVKTDELFPDQYCEIMINSTTTVHKEN